MKTVTIPESEYLQMQQQLKRLQDQLKYYMASQQLMIQCPTSHQPVSIKRGSAKTIITYIAEDFTAPLQDFQDYLS